MTPRSATTKSTARAAGSPSRTPPVPTQHLAELAWNTMEREGEDVLVPKETILTDTHATESQFTRFKGYIRDHITLEKGKAFLSYRGGYLITSDPGKIAENLTWRLRKIDTELRRLLSGWINPLGDEIRHHEVLLMYQEDIGHMLRVSERMRKASAAMPNPVKRQSKGRRRTAANR
jgi:hypothetical protein